MFKIYSVYVSWRGKMRVEHVFADKQAYDAFIAEKKADSDFELSDESEEMHNELYLRLQSQAIHIYVHTDGMVNTGEIIKNGITCARDQTYALPELAEQARAEVNRVSNARIEHGNSLYASSPWL